MGDLPTIVDILEQPKGRTNGIDQVSIAERMHIVAARPPGCEPDQAQLVESQQLVGEQAHDGPGEVAHGPPPIRLGPGIGVRSAGSLRAGRRAGRRFPGSASGFDTARARVPVEPAAGRCKPKTPRSPTATRSCQRITQYRSANAGVRPDQLKKLAIHRKNSAIRSSSHSNQRNPNRPDRLDTVGRESYHG